ncbi:hypothetical protein RA955_05930 [Geobacillus proteiniphilus]|uniref:Uncharacterized protein n=1 Tax=Geobacillus proteiniphilus TaxID=860353 RepID=A0A1Q5T7L8_9BACL|nr:MULTISPECIES: hypothetical protein [Geobacillus]OKO96203.1 hypothetical protein BRO54_0620 [Geobacillus proteiniphilus]OPX00514.1 hypothetical protein B1A75_17885 [Geobacillus sp. LEMMY01]WMJ17597.1 hypothetical protein RA955_05930 [Geobacillus proteiniphilus]
MEKNKSNLPELMPAEFRVSTDLHVEQWSMNEETYAGDSVGEHTALEQANEYLAAKEISQTFENS